MRIINDYPNWSLVLTIKPEAVALLEAQEMVGKTVMPATDLNYDRVGPGKSAVELLHLAELVLPSAGVELSTVPVEVWFKTPEAKHLSSLMYLAIIRAEETGRPTTANDGILYDMNAQIAELFGMEE